MPSYFTCYSCPFFILQFEWLKDRFVVSRLCHVNNINRLKLYIHHRAIFATRTHSHIAREVSSITGFLLGRIAWRQKLISNSTEINGFVLTSLVRWHNKGSLLFWEKSTVNTCNLKVAVHCLEYEMIWFGSSDYLDLVLCVFLLSLDEFIYIFVCLKSFSSVFSTILNDHRATEEQRKKAYYY